MTTSSPTFTSSRTSKSTRSSTRASFDVMVRAILIRTGVSSARPNVRAVLVFGVELWAGAAFGSAGEVVCGCWESADDDTIKQKAIEAAIRRTVFIVFSFGWAESEREAKAEERTSLTRSSVSMESTSGELQTPGSV